MAVNIKPDADDLLSSRELEERAKRCYPSSARPASYGGVELDTIRQSPRAFGEVSVIEDMADEILRLRITLGAADAALAQCQPCAEPECGAVQRDYIDTARESIARVLRHND